MLVFDMIYCLLGGLDADLCRSESQCLIRSLAINLGSDSLDSLHLCINRVDAFRRLCKLPIDLDLTLIAGQVDILKFSSESINFLETFELLRLSEQFTVKGPIHL